MAFFNDTQVIQKIKTTPMAPAGCHTHRHASRESYYKNMISYITIQHSSQLLAISHHMINRCKNKLDVL